MPRLTRLAPAFAPILAPVLAVFTAFAVPLAQPVQAQGIAGAFLAMREARVQNDFTAATVYLNRLLAAEPGNPITLESLAIAHLSLGEHDQAVTHARELVQIEADNRAATLILMTHAFATQDYAEARRLAEQGNSIHPLLDGLALAWAQYGAGSMSDALTTLNGVAAAPDLRPFALYVRALTLALVGDVEGALAIFEAEDQPLRGALNRRGYLAYAQLLGLSERYDEGLALLNGVFANPDDPDVARLVQAFNAGSAPGFDLITAPEQGMAEVLAVLATAMSQVDNPREALIYARAGLWLNPSLDDTKVLVGEVFETLDQPREAARAYASVDENSVFAMVAQIGQAQILQRLGDTDQALDVLTEMEQGNPTSVAAPQVVGDFYRQIERYDDAVAAYDRSQALMQDQGLSPTWQFHFSRAVAYERSGDWPAAEIDFRAALDIEPDQPTVLNYLGYSLVDRGEKLDEALDMIERAVAERPDSGAIVDSLAWALFRLGRYDEAVPHMERAVELLPTDPILNDHLGDVYWAVGRQREARFQWSRALSFGPSPDMDDDRVRRKIEVGLDIVRAEAGEPPLHAGEQ